MPSTYSWLKENCACPALPAAMFLLMFYSVAAAAANCLASCHLATNAFPSFLIRYASAYMCRWHKHFSPQATPVLHIWCYVPFKQITLFTWPALRFCHINVNAVSKAMATTADISCKHVPSVHQYKCTVRVPKELKHFRNHFSDEFRP